jgi:iron(III) transport system permease protein
VILFTSETKVLSVLIFDLKESGDVGAIAVLSLTMVILTTVVIVIANRVGAGVRRSGSRQRSGG